MQGGEILVALLVPVVTALLGAFGIVLRDLYERRSERGRYKHAYDDATRKVAFATEWWKAKQELGVGAEELQSARETAQVWLREATALIDQSVQPPRRPEDRYSVTRRALLAYPFERISARLLRIVYYFFLFFMALGVLFTIPRVDEYTGADWTGELITLVFYGLLALGARAWSVSIEQRAARRKAKVSTPISNVSNHQVSAPQSFPSGPSPTPGMGWYGPSGMPPGPPGQYGAPPTSEFGR